MLPLRDRYLLFVLLAASLVLKLLWTGTNALAHDEPFTVYWALRPWKEFLAMLGTENNPPLYFMLMRGWVSMVPLDPAWLRIPSAVSSALVVVPLFLIGKRLAGTWAATTAVLVFSLNGYHYGFAHEVRAYALFTLLTVAAIWQLLRLADGRERAWAWLLIFNILLIYTHFFGWLAVGLQVLFVLVIKDLGHLLRRWLWMLGALIISYLPYIYTFFIRAQESMTQGTWLSRPPAEEVYNMIWRWSNAPVIAIALLVLVGVTFLRPGVDRSALKLTSLWAFAPLIGLFIVSYWIPVFLDRYLVFAAPGWALLAGYCLSRLPGSFGPLAAIIIVSAFALTFEPRIRSKHYPEQVVDRVEDLRTAMPCAPVLVVPSWYRSTYRFAQAPEQLAKEPPAMMHSNQLEPGSSECPVLILVDAAPPDAGSRALLERLDRTHFPADSIEASHKVWVIRYIRRSKDAHIPES